MYRWLLCWRYLRTRYIALASVISMTLGVATLIVVNSVMDGFTTEMQDRMHGILSDVILESHSANGLPNHEAIQQRIRQVVGDDLEGMTTVVHVPAMVSIDHRGESITRHINLVGIDSQSYANVSDFSKYLLHPENQEQISFALKEHGYAPDRENFPESGWVHRRRIAAARKRMVQLQLEHSLAQQENDFLRGLQAENNDYLRELVDSVDVMAPRNHLRHDDIDKSNHAGDIDRIDVDQIVDAAGVLPSVASPSAETLGALGNPNLAASEGLVQSSEQPAAVAEQAVAASQLESPLPAPPAEYASSGSKANFTTQQSDDASTSTEASSTDGETQLPAFVSSMGGPSVDAVATRPEDRARVFDAEQEQHDGIVLGISIGTTRYRDAQSGEVADYYYVQPGDDVRVTFPSAGNSPTAIHKLFTVVDFYESKMSEYDSTFAFVPIERLQAARGMEGAICSIQLRLRKGTDLNHVRDTLRAQFPLEMMLQINTWRDLQGALLAAVQMETTILNILLFLIIAVAGFGILATFFMIVVEKTKDIGVLKSLGASGAGVASIFLGYGLLLGIFGAGVGAVAGLIFVANINSVADVLERITGREVFDPTVYYFETIPTIVHPAMVVWVIIGAVAIAVMASVLPSIRAARMHPVEALRYE